MAADDPTPQVSAEAVRAVARAFHADDVEELGPRVTVENPPLPTVWEELDPEDVQLYERGARTAIRVLIESGELVPAGDRARWAGNTSAALDQLAGLRAERDQLRSERDSKVALRLDGEPEAFVWGSHDAIKRVQALGDERDALKAELERLHISWPRQYNDLRGRFSALLDAVERHRGDGRAPIARQMQNLATRDAELYETADRIKRGQGGEEK